MLTLLVVIVHPLPGSDLRLVISDRIKLDIEAGKLTGIDFSPVPVS
jgi:hypothetical protein